MLIIIYLLSILCSNEHFHDNSSFTTEPNILENHNLLKNKLLVNIGNFYIKKENLLIYLNNLEMILNTLITDSKLRNEFCLLICKIFNDIINKKIKIELDELINYFIFLMNSYTASIEELYLLLDKFDLEKDVEEHFAAKSECKRCINDFIKCKECLNKLKNSCNNLQHTEGVISDSNFTCHIFTDDKFKKLPNLYQYAHNFVLQIITTINYLKKIKKGLNNEQYNKCNSLNLTFDNNDDSVDVDIQFGFSNLFAQAKTNIKNQNLFNNKNLHFNLISFNSSKIVLKDLFDKLEYIEDSFSNKVAKNYIFIDKCKTLNDKSVFDFFINSILEISNNLKIIAQDKDFYSLIYLFSRPNSIYNNFNLFSNSKEYSVFYNIFKDTEKNLKEKNITTYNNNKKQLYDINTSVINFMINYILNESLFRYYLFQ